VTIACKDYSKLPEHGKLIPHNAQPGFVDKLLAKELRNPFPAR